MMPAWAPVGMENWMEWERDLEMSDLDTIAV